MKSIMIRREMLRVGFVLVICSVCTNSCNLNQYVVQNDLGPDGCLPCPDCPPGQEPKYFCGSSIGLETITNCSECPDGKYSHIKGNMRCQPCKQCVKNELMTGTCNSTSDSTICTGTCKPGFTMNDQKTVCLPNHSQNTSTLKTRTLFNRQSPSTTGAHFDRIEFPSTAKTAFPNKDLSTNQSSETPTVPLFNQQNHSSTIGYVNRTESEKQKFPSTTTATFPTGTLTKQSSKASADPDWRIIVAIIGGTLIFIVLGVVVWSHCKKSFRKEHGVEAGIEDTSCRVELLERCSSENDISVKTESSAELPEDCLTNLDISVKTEPSDQLSHDCLINPGAEGGNEDSSSGCVELLKSGPSENDASVETEPSYQLSHHNSIKPGVEAGNEEICFEESLKCGPGENDISVKTEPSNQLPQSSSINAECRPHVTKIDDLKHDTYCEICLTLDAGIHRKDWKALAGKMKKTMKCVDEIECYCKFQKKSPADVLLRSWGKEEGNDVMKLIELLKEVGLTQLASDVEKSL